MRMLSHVQSREVKTEGAHAAYETPYQEVARMPAAIGQQAVGRQLNVGEQLLRALIGIGPAIVSRLEPLADLTEENAIRLPIVPRRRQFLGARQQLAYASIRLAKRALMVMRLALWLKVSAS